MADFPVLLERRLLLAESGDQPAREIVIEIGHPYWVEQGLEAACPIAIRGLDDGVNDIHGIDLLDAMELSLKFVRLRLEKLRDTHQISWPDGELYFDA